MMKIKYLIKPPCQKCPYTLGQVKFIKSPCPHCRLDNYRVYESLISNQYKNER